MGRYDDIDPMDIDPETNRPYAGYHSPALDTSFHDGEMDVDDEDDLEDMIDEAISDSLDVDWTSRDGAKAVLRALEEAGFVVIKPAPAAAPLDDGDDEDDGYPPRCTNPGGHEYPRDIEESERCLCVHCGADGDA